MPFSSLPPSSSRDEICQHARRSCRASCPSCRAYFSSLTHQPRASRLSRQSCRLVQLVDILGHIKIDAFHSNAHQKQGFTCRRKFYSLKDPTAGWTPFLEVCNAVFCAKPATLSASQLARAKGAHAILAWRGLADMCSRLHISKFSGSHLSELRSGAAGAVEYGLRDVGLPIDGWHHGHIPTRSPAY